MPSKRITEIPADRIDEIERAALESGAEVERIPESGGTFTLIVTRDPDDVGEEEEEGSAEDSSEEE